MTPSPRLTPEQRDRIAADAARRYAAGESWADIAAIHGLSREYVRRLTVARHDITYRRWGQRPILDDLEEVRRRRADGQTLDQIAEVYGCSRQAVRTALEETQQAASTRYPRLAARRLPSPAELGRLRELMEACPPAPRARPGALDVRSPEGRALAGACRAVVNRGVPMETLSRALDHGPSWVHRLLQIHDLRPAPRPVQSTTRRTRDSSEPNVHDRAADTSPDTP